MRLLPSTQSDYLFSPTDLSRHVNCGYLTLLNREVAQGKLDRPTITDPYFHMITERGRQFEKKYVESLKRDSDLQVIDFTEGDDKDHHLFDRTMTAMKEGADIIVQGYLKKDGWAGHPDLLRKVDQPSDLGAWSYEVLDTKLAMETKAGSVLQLCVYTDMLGAVQGKTPEKMYIVKPGESMMGFTSEAFTFHHYAAYYRTVQRDFIKKVEEAHLESLYPEAVNHCEICSFRWQCDGRRREDDHLVYVAGIRKNHRLQLEDQGIKTMQGLASDAMQWKPEKGSMDTYLNLQAQASLQVRGTQEKTVLHEVLRFEEGEGLHLLPEPNPGDVFFDIEADRFLEGGGIEYLFGIYYQDGQGEYQYRPFWALNRSEEKQQFERLIDFLDARLAQFPGMYIYHFGHYETSALRRLMTRHNTRRTRLDVLLRGERFIDLLQVVRQSIRASVESYSIKNLEPLYDFSRETDLQKAGWSLRAIQRFLEFDLEGEISHEAKETVENYNKEDCISTYHLRVWLEGIRSDLQSQGMTLHRPERKSGEATEKVTEAENRIDRLLQRITTNLPEDQEEYSEEDHMMHLLGNLLGYFRREDKCYWWDYFRLVKLEEEDLRTERHAVVDLTFNERIGGSDQCPIHRYSYPDQEISFKSDAALIDRTERKIGTVVDSDPAQGTIDVKKRGDAKEYHPRHMIVDDYVGAWQLEKCLLDVSETLITQGPNGPDVPKLFVDLLLRRTPRFGNHQGHALLQEGESTLAGARRLALDMQDSILPIQGPPGTGKTYSGARVILELVKAGKKIGVTALGHKAIVNLLEEIQSAAKEQGTSVQLVHKGKKKSKEIDGFQEVSANKDAIAAVSDGKIVGGTVWLWAHESLIHALDYLVVDEAGQLSLAHVLCATRSTRNMILLGDPQQLEQPQQAAHPEDSDVSALDHLLQHHATMADDRGLFLDQTYRMHDDICDFTSELYYDARLKPAKDLVHQSIITPDGSRAAGLFYLPVAHEGNSHTSYEEVQQIDELVSKLCTSSYFWQDKSGKTHKITAADIMVVAPYNAQVGALKRALPDIEVGTVDKFQGREAPIVMYSMASSSPQDAPRGMRFLYDPSRLNVATSRARCACILVAAPAIFNTDCHTPEQMKWANGYCRYLEKSQLVLELLH